MTTELRVMLFFASILMFGFIIYKIRRSKMQTMDATIWIFFSAVLIIITVYPKILFHLKSFLGIESTVNCVFLVIIFLLIIIVFLLCCKISKLEYDTRNAIEDFSVREYLKSKNEAGCKD